MTIKSIWVKFTDTESVSYTKGKNGVLDIIDAGELVTVIRYENNLTYLNLNRAYCWSIELE